jgi:AcrR family transcriptional regulator
MAKRIDGRNTRARLLEAAMEVFATKGFRDTTITDICRSADTNVASVNYHFGSKEQLYAEVWRQAFDAAERVHPHDGGLGPDAPVQERLRALIHSLLHKVLDEGRLGCAGQILLLELGQQTDALERVRQDAIRPIRDWTLNIMKELLGPEVTEPTLVFCTMSVIHQCLAFGLRRGKIPAPLRHMDNKELIPALVGHITRFSLAGIAAVRCSLEQEDSNGKS